MKTKIIVNHSQGFNINEFGDKLREFSSIKNRVWYYDEISFSDSGEGKGEIIISYKDYTNSAFPHANVIMSEIDSINSPFVKVIDISDIK